jgi:hypothetical protein
MLSAVSGFTQSSNEELGTLLPREIQAMAEADRKIISDAGSSGSGTSGSIGDPKSPIETTRTVPSKWQNPWDAA